MERIKAKCPDCGTEKIYDCYSLIEILEFIIMGAIIGFLIGRW